MDKLNDLTAVLMEMGYSIYDIERAYIGGHKTIESAIAFISGEVGPVENTESSNRLILRPTQQVPSTEFNLQPVYVNLSDMHWSNQNADDKPDPTKSLIEKPYENPMQSSSGTTSVNDRFEWQQRESRKIAEAIRKEKAIKQQERERLRAEVAAERQAKQQTAVATDSSAPVATCSTANRDSNNPEPSKRENMMKIKIVLFERPHAHFYINLNPSASYADLLDEIKPILLSSLPERDVPSVDILPASDATLIALDQHLRSLSTTDDCIRLIVQAWPRRELPHPCANTSQPDASLTNQRLTDMQITGGTTIAIRHVNCAFRAQVMEKIAHLNESRPPESLHPNEVEETSEEEAPEAADYPMDQEWEPTVQDRFPGQGQQLRPQPPDGALPVSAFSVQENVRRAALTLAERLHHTTAPTPSAPVTESVWNHVPSLMMICFDTVVTAINQYVDALNAVQSGSMHDNTPRRTVTGKRAFIDRRTDAGQSDQSGVNRHRLEYVLVHQLPVFQWPPVLGQKLVRTLMEKKCFNVHTALFLYNCVSRLDLSHYFLVTTDLVFCLSDRWSNLVELLLNSVNPFQVATDAICALKRLQNLTSLSLNGLHTVNNEALPYLLELRQLRVLRLCDTTVGDDAWIEALHREQSETTGNSRPLTTLELARMGPLITDAGLCAIVQLFPMLHFLNLSQCHIIGSDSNPNVTSLTRLIKLDLSGCTLLRGLPRTLLPFSSTSAEDDSGLRQLLIGGCERLDLSELLLRLKGQPICRLDGLLTIPSLNSALLRQFFSSGFPLTDVFLTACNFTWFYEDPTLLAFILSSLPTNTLTRLSLPLRPLHYSDNRELQTAVCNGLRRLGQCTKLCDLDLGGQIVGLSQFEAILTALANLRALRRLTVTDLAQDQETKLRQGCSHNCRIRIHRHP